MSEVKIGHFDICKAMAEGGLDIRIAPMENVLNLRKVKAGTQVTIGVEGDLVAAIGIENKFVGGLMLIDKEQYFATKARLEAATPKATRCGECGGTGELVNDGPYSVCDDCGGTGIEHSGVCHCGEEMDADGPFAHDGHAAVEMTRTCETCTPAPVAKPRGAA